MPEQQRDCRTCRHFTHSFYYLAGEATWGEVCDKRLSCFPEARYCQSFEREPGSDDV
jgi:hypothetical protein